MNAIEVVLYFVIGSCVITLVQAFRTAGGPRGVYLAMLAAEIVLSGALLAKKMFDSPLLWLAALVYVVLVPLPTLLAVAARRAAMGEKLRLAARLAHVRELLMPSARSRFDREQLEALANVRAGHGEEAIAKLRTAAQKDPDPMMRRLLGEQLVSLLVFDRRFDAALAEYEGIGGERLTPPLSPPVTAQLVRAAVETGELERAADLLGRLEAAPFAATLAAQPLLAQARMFFLAGLGRTDDVVAITSEVRGAESGGTAPLADLPAVARAYWVGLAAARGGRRDQAMSSLSRAVELSKTDAGGSALARRRLSEVEDGSGLGPVAVPEALARLADRVGTAARAARLPRITTSGKRAPVTIALIAACAALFAALEIVGSSESLDLLVRAGANVPSLVEAGQWWRLPASVFLHIGAVHLFLNMYSLWVMGRLIEERLGSVRYFAVYMLAGLGGALASFLHMRERTAALSAGASGAIFGLLGASIMLFWRDRTLPDRVRRGLVNTLLFLAGLNVVLGMMMPQIDQAAHIGGFATGALIGLVLAPGGLLPRRLARGLALLLALGGLGSVGYAGLAVVQSFRGSGMVQQTSEGLALEAPESWRAVPGLTAWVLEDPDTGGRLQVARDVSGSTPAALAEEIMRAFLLDPTRGEAAVSVPLVPADADHAQREITMRQGDGVVRVAIVVRRLAGGDLGVVQVSMQHPDLVRRAPELRALIQSLRSDRP